MILRCLTNCMKDYQDRLNHTLRYMSNKKNIQVYIVPFFCVVACDRSIYKNINSKTVFNIKQIHVKETRYHYTQLRSPAYIQPFLLAISLVLLIALTSVSKKCALYNHISCILICTYRETVYLLYLHH